MVAGQNPQNARLFGHRNGVENVRAVVNTAKEVGVPYITLYAFSTENQNRPRDEKSGLMKLLEEFLKKELRSMMEDGIRLRAIGDLSGLPDFAQKIVEDTIVQTKENENWNLTLALNYGSRQEVLKAVAITHRTIQTQQLHQPGKSFLLFGNCGSTGSGPNY